MMELVGTKLGIPPTASTKPDGNKWQEFIKNPANLVLGNWEPSKYEHPLIAKHKDGGKTT
jgi:hypothetical protein